MTGTAFRTPINMFAIAEALNNRLEGSGRVKGRSHITKKLAKYQTMTCLDEKQSTKIVSGIVNNKNKI
jgi:hypothetical protein